MQDLIIEEVDIPFRVTDLKQWVYCPRILYYQVCLPDIQPVTYKMEVGIEAGKEEEGREARRSLQRYGILEGRRAYNVPVASPVLGLRGSVDMVIWPEGEAEIIPVDYKLSRQASPHYQLQLLAYGLMLEETYGLPSRRGFLYSIPLRRSEEVLFRQQLKTRLQAALTEMQRMQVAEWMPSPTPQRNKCVACEFRRFCNDIF